MTLFEIPMPSDAMLGFPTDDPAARLRVTKNVAHMPCQDPYCLGGCPTVIEQGDSHDVLCGAFAFAVGTERHPGPDARTTCANGHVHRRDEWPGYRKGGPVVTAVQRPVALASEDHACVVVGSRLVRMRVGMTPQGWRLATCMRGTVVQVNASAPGSVAPGISWVVDWGQSADAPPFRSIAWFFDWWPRGVSRVSAPSMSEPWPSMTGLALEKDAMELEGLLRFWLKRWLREQRRALDDVETACSQDYPSQVAS